MDHVKTLLQYVVRSFYDTRHVIVLDAILRHDVISDDDLPQMVGIQKKELHKICAKLRDDLLLSTHTRAEPREGQQRPAQKTYYFVQFGVAVDAVKWRIHKLGETFNDQMRNDVDRQGYVCPHCKRRYTALEALPLQAMDLSGFICADCGSILMDDDDVDELRVSQERLAKLMSQIRRIVDTLKKIDDSYIPDNDFETALKIALPTSADIHETQDSIVYAAKGTNTNTMSIEVDLSEGDKNKKAAAAAAAAKADAAQQNALPVWYQKSTIGLENPGSNGTRDGEDTKPAASALDENVKPEIKSEPGAAGGEGEDAADPEDVIAAYYKSLQNANDEGEEEDDDDDEEEEEEVEDEDEDEDEFEEVV
ncbi:TFIIE alpha subunit-domain-containing protein [Lipomyces arxii]|uniref:TFIIE alpha subunit-domain-containing protein n=1 Tax=Lipomyces arxii TaxID=56418 RepID=UPI0034CDADF8